MITPVSIRALVTEGWQSGLAALAPNLSWLALLAMAGGAYSASLHMGGNLAAPLALAVLMFLAGLQFSYGLYAKLLAAPSGGFLPLAHANLAVYLAFVFIGFFVAFFLLMLPGILIEAQGKYQLGEEASPELVQKAFTEMLPTAYGAVYLIVAAAGLGILSFFALRLTLFGAATAAGAKAVVFQTFPLTKGHVLKLGAASLATHVAPFAAGLGANLALRSVMPETLTGHVIEGAGGIVLFTPFLLAGHGMAATAWRYLQPRAPVEPGAIA